jgi:hypothetical protein
VELLPAVPEPEIYPFFRQPRRSRRLRLLEGDNSLLVRIEPPSEARNAWFLVAAVKDEEGKPMADIDFNVSAA